MSILKTGPGATLVRTGATVALALAAVGAFATSSSAATSTMTSSPATGVPAGGNSIVLTLAAPTATANNKFVSGSVGVQFQYAATPSSATCASLSGAGYLGETALATGVSPAGVVTVFNAKVRYLATNKVSVVVPDLHTGPNTWIVCAYGIAAATDSTAGHVPVTGEDITATGALTALGKASYTTTTPPAVSSLDKASGSALGGQTVTVTGTGFPTTINSTTPLTVSIGGVAVPNANVSAIDATHFSFVTPPHVAATAQTVTVTTASGSGTGGTYAFANGIDVEPNTLPTNTNLDVDIAGVGFLGSTMTFTTADEGVSSGSNTAAGTNSTNAHVYLVAGTYNGAGYHLGTTTNKTNGQLSECNNVAVISDTELICTMHTDHSYNTTTAGTYTWSGTAVPVGTYTVTIVNDGDAVAPAYQTVVSSGSTFTVAPF